MHFAVFYDIVNAIFVQHIVHLGKVPSFLGYYSCHLQGRAIKGGLECLILVREALISIENYVTVY